jgi:hypothetical protein
MEKIFLWFVDNRHDTVVEGNSTVAYIVVVEISQIAHPIRTWIEDHYSEDIPGPNYL